MRQAGDVLERVTDSVTGDDSLVEVGALRLAFGLGAMPSRADKHRISGIANQDCRVTALIRHATIFEHALFTCRTERKSVKNRICLIITSSAKYIPAEAE